jgi:hypothetical protein
MDQLEKAKEAVENTRESGLYTNQAMCECLLSIAISLDEKNKANQIMRKSWLKEHSKLSMEERRELHTQVPPNPTCHYCGEEITGSFWYSTKDQRTYHTNCHDEKHRRIETDGSIADPNET